MKASVLIKMALEQGFYVREDVYEKDSYLKLKASVYMCHALEIIQPESEHTELAKALIMKEFDNECLTLFTYMSRHDKKYKSYRARWGHDSRACFNLRVKWYENLIIELESRGL